MTNLIFLDPNQAKRPNIPIIIGQGVLTSIFSSQIKKYNRGSKKPSIDSPYALEKSLKLKSIPFLRSLKAFPSITGILLKNSIVN